jgi:hypothetical protein
MPSSSVGRDALRATIESFRNAERDATAADEAAAVRPFRASGEGARAHAEAAVASPDELFRLRAAANAAMSAASAGERYREARLWRDERDAIDERLRLLDAGQHAGL